MYPFLEIYSILYSFNFYWKSIQSINFIDFFTLVLQRGKEGSSDMILVWNCYNNWSIYKIYKRKFFEVHGV